MRGHRTMIEHVCQQCGARFLVKAYRAETAKYCSPACMYDGKKAKSEARETLARRFWAKVDMSDADGCWLWTGATWSNGYGVIGIGGKVGGATGAHRASWELAYGPINPPDLLVCHHCDNRRCVRPDHLFLGTAADNLADMDKKGRRRNAQTAGEMNGRARLTEEQVRRILARLANGTPPRALATEYQVSYALIYAIKSGRLWRHVASPIE